MHRNPILGGTMYDPRLKSHSKPQRFKIIHPTMRIDSKALIVPLKSSETRYFETSSAEIGKLDRNSLQESKFAPQNVDKVLRFYAFFLETVDESNSEELRLRKSVILEYVSDNTFEILEPRVLNSGIPQGAFLKRCQLPKLSGFYAASDLFLGMELPVFGRIFKIYDCDAFTREYFSKMSWNIGCSITIPDDKYTITRKEITKLCGGDVDHFYGKIRYPLKTFMEASLGNSVRSHLQSEKKRKFLANACKILCFNCEYDDQKQLYGALMRYKLCFFLEDDTMEIKEVLSPNSGRLPFPLLLKRSRQLKAWTEFLSDDQDRGVEEPKPREAYFNEEDLYVGAVLNVFGRDLKLVDSDAFTRDYYRVVWGLELAGSMSTAPEEIVSPVKRPILEKCAMDSNHAPKKDLLKLVEFDRKVLRFVAKLISSRKEQSQRRVVIAYYLADDTIAIFEPEQRNSGISPGKFLERGQYKSPQGKPYVFSQLVIGEEATFNAHRFEILDADEYTKNYLAA
uniref:RIB72 protein putative n=1 Tax=Albugo laibachii Nc14 TaxID=890382 RepID=F0W0J6_9STRA|nr:RIB72 protein putative [Albugo laibachii Nc14]|eukprot:CCA14568.1 RIB72 protein putative [Albugo laibachii Nc14]